MNKRQRKKNATKLIPVIADESNLLFMTPEEYDKAIADYTAYCKKYAFRKKYKDLKTKSLSYYFTIPFKTTEIISTIARLGSSKNKSSFTVTQSIDDFVVKAGSRERKLNLDVSKNQSLNDFLDNK